jgi:hypothetical protein
MCVPQHVWACVLPQCWTCGGGTLALAAVAVLLLLRPSAAVRVQARGWRRVGLLLLLLLLPPLVPAAHPARVCCLWPVRVVGCW